MDEEVTSCGGAVAVSGRGGDGEVDGGGGSLGIVSSGPSKTWTCDLLPLNRAGSMVP